MSSMEWMHNKMGNIYIYIKKGACVHWGSSNVSSPCMQKHEN